jgi:hypothetical protein
VIDGGDSKRRCGKRLKPLISKSAGHNRQLPGVFKGDGWAFKDSKQYREYTVEADHKKDPFGMQAAKDRRDPIAVR